MDQTKQAIIVNPTFDKSHHYQYLMALDKSKDLDSIGYYLSEHLRLPGAYWTINSLACLDKLNTITPEKKSQLSNYSIYQNSLMAQNLLKCRWRIRWQCSS
jgi:prenyltransferase beta subunit